MKVLTYTFLIFILPISSFSQNDSLKLVLTFEVDNNRYQNPKNFRVDFISFKKVPIAFQYQPVFLLECNLDDITIEEETLVNNCFLKISKSECHPSQYDLKRKKEMSQLQYGDTSTFRYNLKRIDIESFSQKINERFTDNFRFRVARYYYENGVRKQIFSNWLYINYP